MADVVVRPARLGDVAELTAVQLKSWRTAEGLPPGEESVPDVAEAERAWQRAVMVPPTDRHCIWVAAEAEVVVGLAALAPASDPDLDPTSTTELLVLTVDPDRRQRGHGSRLLAAAMQAVADGGQQAAITWVAAQDDASRQFLSGAGWGVDGAHRSLAAHDDSPASDRLRQVRMGTDLSSDSS